MCGTANLYTHNGSGLLCPIIVLDGVVYGNSHTFDFVSSLCL